MRWIFLEYYEKKPVADRINYVRLQETQLAQSPRFWVSGLIILTLHQMHDCTSRDKNRPLHGNWNTALPGCEDFFRVICMFLLANEYRTHTVSFLTFQQYAS